MGLLCIIIEFTWIINALQLLSVQVHAAVSISVASDMIPASVATPLSVSNTLAQQQVASNMMAPGIGSQTVYSIGSSTPNLQPPQYTTQQQPPQFTTQPPQYAAQQISIGLQVNTVYTKQ